MFLNRSVQKPHHKVGTKSPTTSPDYAELVKFLTQPFLDSPGSLKVDCEISQTGQRAWIRVAFDDTDKGKVFGRGGRNIQAIRAVLAAAADAAGHSVYLDIYGSASANREEMSFDEDREEPTPPRTREKRGDGPSKPVAKPRFRSS